MKEKMVRFLKEETVLCAALLLAALSLPLVPPDREYLAYIDFRTLAILFCLMGVMAGLQETGVFRWIAQGLLLRVRKSGQLLCLLVLLCFFSSMVITNDVALITFVPFTLTVLGMLGEKMKKRLLLPALVLQTVGANLGSMLTPIGNPQNLYLYGKSGSSLGSFVFLMLPYTGISLILLLLCCAWFSRGSSGPVQVSFEERVQLSGKGGRLIGLFFLFCFDLLTVARLVPYGAALAVTSIGLLLLNRSAFLRVDYSLLLTFAGFFIFIGNMGRLPVFSAFLQNTVSGHEILTGVIASQVISNVPAALLLSGFTEDLQPLIIGVNIGGLGTLIASMASLISYKFLAREESAMRGKYFRLFTLINLLFLAVLLLAAYFLG